MSQHNKQAVADAHLAVEAAMKVVVSSTELHDAMLLTGSKAEIERYRAAVHSAVEAWLDRKAELIWAQMVRDGIDPRTRHLF